MASRILTPADPVSESVMSHDQLMMSCEPEPELAWGGSLRRLRIEPRFAVRCSLRLQLQLQQLAALHRSCCAGWASSC